MRPALKRLPKVATTSMAKWIKAGQKKFISAEFVSSSQNESNLNILLLTSAQRQKLAHQKSISKYSNNLIDESAGGNLLGNNNLAYINSDIHINTKVKSNLDENMTGDNLHKKYSEMNIKNLFQQIRDQILCERLTREVLKQTCHFFHHPIKKIFLSDRVPIGKEDNK